MKIVPLICEFDGEAYRPVTSRGLEIARAQHGTGERVTLIEYDPRSRLSHDHFFICVRGYWQNWPEDYPVAIANEDQLRKHALIATGHYDESACAFESAEAAAAYITMMTRSVDYAEFSDFAEVVVVRIAKTQRKKAMGAALFQQSKSDVLEFLASVVGVKPEEMKTQSARIAA